jgi:hypothetical protein
MLRRSALSILSKNKTQHLECSVILFTKCKYNCFKVDLTNLESKLRGLENDLLLNQKTIEKIKETVDEMQKEQGVIREESKAIRAKGKSPVNKTFASIHKLDVAFAQTKPNQVIRHLVDWKSDCRNQTIAVTALSVI